VSGGEEQQRWHWGHAARAASVACAGTVVLLGPVVVCAAALGLGRVGRGGVAAVALGSLRRVAGVARA